MQLTRLQQRDQQRTGQFHMASHLLVQSLLAVAVAVHGTAVMEVEEVNYGQSPRIPYPREACYLQ
jgi:hypothetical protein